ncbi:rRNA methylase [Bellilinea caldifistulae]|uniref:RNA methyltransferase n=1 Tax=Bellilinea caldifistulae TaxID=360411 RepID=UPI0009E24312|nr:RNA methyltransferase [Bellilinea caldifistulae]GAP10680.1 rRNA methylase [Bellilinea caldifistulae]
MKSAPSSYHFYQCSNPKCALRIPAGRAVQNDSLKCPRCTSPLLPVPTPQEVLTTLSQSRKATRPAFHLEALLDNIRSTFNVGAMFRIADGAGISHLYLSGLTPLPGNPRISKTALGAEFAVPWEYAPNGLQLAQSLKADGKTLWALETTPSAVSLFEIQFIPKNQPLVLVAGNEVSGIDPAILELCDEKIFIPMSGYKRSLNVAVAFGIAVYHLAFAVPSGLTDLPIGSKIQPQ